MRTFLRSIGIVLMAVLIPASLFAGGQSPVEGFGPVNPQRISGVIAQGLITPSNLSGPLAGQPLSALVNAIQAGAAYVSVYTKSHPYGEVRGQVR